MLDPEIRSKYTVVVGLEVHAQLLTESKAYASDATSYGDDPNDNVSVITLAHPGTLPKANHTVVDYAIRMGLAVGSDITRYNFYDRKNYFYPDLPKGYQVTQDKTPICRGGHVDIKLKDGREKRIQVTRIHMEEDAGKNLHLPGARESLIDLNRAGTPLIEIVSEPDIRSSEEAYAYLVEVHRLVRYLGICDGNMEEGSFRCDANISVMPVNSMVYGKRVEVKNMNSFRNVARAIEIEVERQIQLVEAGTAVVSETRMFDAGTNSTYSLRTKESLNDYRYFPEPDLQPVIVEEAWVNKVREQMPALPRQLHQLFVEQYGLPEYDAGVLIEEREIAQYFDQVCKNTNNYKAASNWVMGPVKSLLNERAAHLEEINLPPRRLAEVIALVDAGKISFSQASQKLLPVLADNPAEGVEAAAQRLDLIMVQDNSAWVAIVRDLMARYPDKVAEYRGGKKGIVGMFMGELMKATGGKANPKEASALIAKELEA